ncbi:MAG: (2Fe-2S)-binding protein [Devosia sp.]
MSAVSLSCTVNGRTIKTTVSARTTLVDFLREELNLTGTHIGCGHGVCGACTVRLDGVPARACLVLAASAEGRNVETIEGLSNAGALKALQEAFMTHGGLQCGYCTPGMLVVAHDLLASTPHPTRDDIRQALAGQICRCTGYGPIVDAIEAAANAAPKGPA